MQEIIIKKLFKDYKELIGKEVLLSGWVRTVRSSAEVGFIEINDGTFFKGVQIVVDKNIDNFETIIKVTIGSAVKIKGEVVESPGAGQDFEIKASEVIIASLAEPDFPLQKKRHSFEFLRTIAHLRPRTNTYLAVFKVRSVLDYAIRKFFSERDFVCLHPPVITSNDCEGAGEMFQITTLNLDNVPKNDKDKTDFKKDFFGKKTGLTVSGQLNAEAFAHAFKKTYTFGPTFRAENSNTSRHVAEFWMIEPEVAFATLEDNMNLAEEMTKYVINYVRAECPLEMEFFNKFRLYVKQCDKNMAVYC